MGDKSTIEWTDATWNPVTGCDRISPGCRSMRLLRLIGRPVVVLLREWAISLAGVAIAAFALGWSSRR